MQNHNENIISDEELAKAFEGKPKNSKKRSKLLQKKKNLIFLIFGIVGIIGGMAILLVVFLVLEKPVTNSDFSSDSNEDKINEIYSDLTGEKLTDASLKAAPVYCVQTPNGTDGARPQAGLTEAGVIFEAIAEAGITRFAAIYQNPSSGVVGPIRSLRIYYLQWDTPFDCTIVHAGGSGDALAAVANGGYKDLTENYEYMYRGTYRNRLWNNLFTTSTYLKKFSEDKGYATSEIKGFSRMTPKESDKARAEATAVHKLIITEPAQGDTSEIKATTPEIGLRLGGLASFNVSYTYDANTNTYLRSYGNGNAHEVYKCPDGDLGEKNPEDACELTQMTPAVVVAMMVEESKASDNYHEDITAIGSGKAYVFQNGTAIEGTWSKSSVEEQIKFLDKNGGEIKLAPGQTFVTAVPNYGNVEF